MTNFLQVSEPEAALLDAQAYTAGDNQRLKDLAANALIAQYGKQAADPTMWSGDVNASTDQQLSPLKVQSAQNELQTQQLAMRQAAELRAAQGVQAAVQKGMDPGAAYDSIVGPNAAALGLSPTDSAAMRDHIVKNPQNIDAIVASLSGQPKPEGMPVMYTKADGTQGAAYITDRGTTVQMELPQGAAIRGKVTGAPIQVDMGNGQYALVQHDQYGNLTATDINGTPLQGETAAAALQRAAAMSQNANTNAFSAGVRANNSQYGAPAGVSLPGAPGSGANIFDAIHGQESGGRSTSPTSVNGAVGGWQVTPQFFKTFAHQGESFANEADRAAVAQRGIAYYQQQYGGDPARVAVAYFSGPQNVAPAGSATPWIKNLKDGNGTHVSDYVGGVLRRMGAGQSVQPGAQADPNAPTPGSGPLFNRVPPKGKQAAISQAAGIVNGADQLQLADQQIERIIDQARNPLATGLGQIAGDIPGLPAYDMKAQTKQLQSLGLTDWIQSLKNSGGSTGIGRVLQSEANAAMSAYGNIDPGQDHAQFIQHVQMFQHRIHQLQATAEAAYKQQWGVTPNVAMGMDQAASGGAPSSTAALRAKYGL